MKKTLAILLSMIMVVSMLAGCSSGSKAAKDSGVGSTDPAGKAASGSVDDGKADGNLGDGESSQAAGEIQTINVIAPGASDMADAEAVVERMNEITRKTIGIEAKITFIATGVWSEQTNLILSGGEVVDLMPWYNTTISTLVANGQAMALDSYYEANKEVLDSIVGEKFINVGRVNGQLYGIPTAGERGGGMGFVMRKDIFEETGFDKAEVKDLDSLYKVLKKAQELHPEMDIVIPQNSSMLILDPYHQIDNLGDELGVLMDAGQSTHVENYYETEEFRSFCETMNQWYEEGLIMKDALNNTAGFYIVPMRAGNSVGAFAAYNVYPEEGATRLCQYEMVQFPLSGIYSSNKNASCYWGIPASSANPDAAFKYLMELETNAELSTLLCCGIEDVNYIYTDKSQYNGVIDYPEGVDGTSSGYATGLQWMMPNEFLVPVWAPNPADYWEACKQLNESAVVSKALGFVYDNTEVINQVTACTNVVSKYKWALMAGAAGDVTSALQKFNEELKAAGIDDIITAKQSQLDAFLK